MRRTVLALAAMLPLILLALMISCSKEKIVENTEYVHDIEYVQLPPDTIIHFDTLTVNDSVTVNHLDTLIVLDTIVQVNQVHDTVIVNHTVTVHDTVVTVQHHYDTSFVVDTVTVQQCNPNQYLAYTAMQIGADQQVIQFINQQFGYTDGWVLYLSSEQVELTRQSANVYDIYGYIDYWTPDWSGYYPLEFFWRMTFTDGDPADPSKWQMSDPPATSPSRQPGVRIAPSPSSTQRQLE